jgi:hypothetical protein
LVIRVAGEGEFVGGPLIEIIGRCIVKRLAFLMRDLATYIRDVFHIRGQAPGPRLVGPLADLLDVPGVCRISRRFKIGRNFP